MVADLVLGDTLAHSIDHTGAVNTKDQRKCRLAMSLRAAAHGHVKNAVDGRCVDPDANLAEARLRIRQGFIFHDLGRAEFVNDDGFHVSAWS